MIQWSRNRARDDCTSNSHLWKLHNINPLHVWMTSSCLCFYKTLNSTLTDAMTHEASTTEPKPPDRIRNLLKKRFPSTLPHEKMMKVSETFRAGPFSEARSLALFPSKPSWTKSSSRLTRSSSTICSAWRLAAMFPRALITAREQCLHKQQQKPTTNHICTSF